MGSVTEREGWGLRGPVRSCRLERTWYTRRCGADACETEERSDIADLEFRADGSLARRKHHNPDGSEWTARYEYNDAGRLATTRFEGAAGPVDSQTLEYDAGGRLIRLVTRSNGAERIAETYEYDSAGGKKKTLYVDVAAQRPDTMYGWGVEGTDSFYSAPGATTLTTLYNDREQPTELQFHDAEGRPLSRVEFRYDEAGNLVEEAQTRSEEALPPELLASLNEAQLQAFPSLFGAAGEPVRRLHQYDEHGRRIETRSQIGPLGWDCKAVVYNDQGDEIAEFSVDEERDYSIDDSGRLSDVPTKERVSRSEVRFRYDYDPRGNWVMKTVESRGVADQDFTLSSVERRTIEYFE